MKIPAPHGHLEALIRDPEGPPRGAAVVCHPHPRHGGTMHTKAVYRAAQALNEAGLTALRFNFRGVGASTGSYDGGRGEEDDVRAALDHLREARSGLPLVAGGFSFGSAVGLRVGAGEPDVRALLGLGLPVSMHDFSFLRSTGKPTLVVQGEHDEFGPARAARETLEGAGDHLTLVSVAGAGHFFIERIDELKAAIRRYFAEGAGSEALRADGGAPGGGRHGEEEAR